MREHVAAPVAEGGQVFRQGITFGGHPVSAAIALTNMDIFARCRLSETRAAPGSLGPRAGQGQQQTTFERAERGDLLRGFPPRRLREAGIIARADDRGDSVLQIAPPLISDEDLLNEIVQALGDVLSDAGTHMGLGTTLGVA